MKGQSRSRGFVCSFQDSFDQYVAALNVQKENPLQYSCLEKSKDRGAWRAAVHGVT